MGILLFDTETGNIDFMGTHPLYRKMGIPRAFLNKVMDELAKGREISITTYREGDKACLLYTSGITDGCNGNLRHGIR